MLNIPALRDEFSRLHTEATGVIDAAAAESRELSDEEKAANETRFSRLQAIKSQIDESAKFAGLAIEGAPEAKGNVTLPKDPAGREAFEASEGRKPLDGDKIDREEFGLALSKWALTGELDRKFATITTATAAGVLLPKQVATPLVPVASNAIRVGMAIHGVPPISSDSTAEMNIPVILAATGTDLSETGTGEENGADGSAIVNNINLKVSTVQSGQVWVSNLELGALDYDLLGAIVPGLADAREMRLEQKAMAAIIADAGITQIVNTATTTGFTYSNLVDLNRKPTTRFDRLKVIYLSNDAYAAAEKLVDGNGNPILNRDTQNQSLMRFNGTPVLKTDFLESLAADNVVGVLISFVGFRLRDAGGPKLIRYSNVPTKDDQTGLNQIGYHAHGYIPSAVVKLRTPAV